MKPSKTAQFALGTLATVVLLAGCSGLGGSQSSAPATGMNPAVLNVRGGGVPALRPGITYTSVQAPKVHSDLRKSHVSPLGAGQRILFVSDDDTNDVYMFTLPSVTLAGTLTGFSEPQGMCTDKSQNVWITNTGTFQIFQYSASGSLLKTLSDPNGYPVGCAINAKNGDLAVTNIINNTGEATVDVYTNATGTPASYNNPSQTENFFAAYDNKGNLYVDGSGGAGFSLSELPSGSNTMHSISISGGTIEFPGGVNWTKSTGLTVGDQECNGSGSCLYAISVAGSGGTITGSTPLHDYNGGACDVDQGAMAKGGKVFGAGCISSSTAPSVAGRWAYPTGGDPTNYSASVEFPIGAAITRM
jgi:hypothetical protein